METRSNTLNARGEVVLYMESQIFLTRRELLSTCAGWIKKINQVNTEDRIFSRVKKPQLNISKCRLLFFKSSLKY